MPNYRRSHVPGGTYFFTVKTELNAPIFANKAHVVRLGNIIRDTVTRWPFEINAIVLLPDHLHAGHLKGWPDRLVRLGRLSDKMNLP